MTSYLSLSMQRLRKSNLGDVLKHARNYLAGDVSAKALGLLSLPIFTRLMSREDYGIVAVYMASVGLLGTLSTLNATDGIGRYYYEEGRSDFGEFLSSVIQLVAFLQIPVIIALLVFRETVMGWLNLPSDLVYFVVLALFHGVVLKIFRAIHVSRKQSKEYVTVNVLQSYTGFGLSWLLLAFQSGVAYMLRITGVVVTQIAAAVWMAYKSLKYVVWQRIQWRHVRYSLHFALPRLPYVLSGVILSQFDRIMLSSMSGPSEAGLYSVGYNVGGLSFIIIGAITPALLPNFYKMMNEKKFHAVDQLNKQIIWIICMGGIGLMLAGGLLLRLLADPEFHAGAEVVPAVVMGYMFYALAGVYNRYSGYYKITILQSLGAFAAGGINIWLNYMWIPSYGIMAAAYATATSYGIQALLTWFLVTKFTKGHTTNIRMLIMPIILVISLFLALNLYA